MKKLANDIWRKLWPRKIRSQLIIGIALVHIVLMAIFVYDMVRRENDFLNRQNREQTLSLASNLAVNGEPFLLVRDYDGLQRLVQSHQQFPFLRYAMFLSTEGIVLAHTDNRNLGSLLTDSISRRIIHLTQSQALLENNDVLDMVVPVRSSNEIVGWARIGMGQENIRENLRNISRNGLMYILLALLVGSVFAIVIARQLSNGLYKLIGTANRIKDGDRNTRSEVFDTDELNQLGNAFNQMIEEITSHHKMTTLILEHMPVAVWILDKDGSIVSVNAEGKKIWGDAKYLPIDQFDAYRGWSPVTGKQLESHEWGGARAILNGETSINEEVEIECFDGSRKTILNSAMPLLDEEGKIIRAVVINVDITEKRKAERDIIQMNYKIGERIKELNCLYKISEIANNADTTMNEILQQSVNLIPAAYQYSANAVARIVFENNIYESPGFRESEWVQKATIDSSTHVMGQIEVYYLLQTPLLDEGPFLKEEQFMINSIADILGSAVEKKKRELELRHSEEKFRGLVEQSLVGVFILKGRHFQYVNPGLAEMSGYTKHELENEIPFDKLVHEKDVEKVVNNYKHRLRGDAVDQNYTFRIYNRSGDIRYVEAFVSRIIFNNEAAVLGTLVDITDRVEEEKRMNKAVTDAQERERMEIGMELHDNVQQIMVGILLNVNFAQQKTDDKAAVDSTLSGVSHHINDAIKELRRLSHQLAPSISGEGSFTDKLTQLVNTMNKSGKMHFEIDVKEEGYAMSEEIQVALYRIVQEQLSNVFKYAAADHVRILLYEKEEVLYLSVQDNGKGFDMSKMKPGIGLVNIRRRVQVLGGQMQIFSAPGEGCQMEATIPLYQ